MMCLTNNSLIRRRYFFKSKQCSILLIQSEYNGATDYALPHPRFTKRLVKTSPYPVSCIELPRRCDVTGCLRMPQDPLWFGIISMSLYKPVLIDRVSAWQCQEASVHSAGVCSIFLYAVSSYAHLRISSYHA